MAEIEKTIVEPESDPASSLQDGQIEEDEEQRQQREDAEAEARDKERREREARAQALTLEIVGDLPYAEVKPPENVLFVCKLNPVTEGQPTPTPTFGAVLMELSYR